MKALWNWIKSLFSKPLQNEQPKPPSDNIVTKPPVTPAKPVEKEPGRPVVTPAKPGIVNPFPQTKYSDNSGKFLINGSGLELVQHFESCFLEAYLDPVNVWTIGWGRIRYPNGKPVKKGDSCTKEEALVWLLHDLYEEGAKYIRSMTDTEDMLNEDQFSALVSFTYNRGAGRYNQKLDDLCDAGLANKHLDAKEIKAITDCILTYNWAGIQNPRYLLGLDRRRWAEKYLFEGKDWSPFKSISWFKAFKERGYK